MPASASARPFAIARRRDIIATISTHSITGAIAVFLVTVLEAMMAAPILLASGRGRARAETWLTVIAVALAAAAVAGGLYLAATLIGSVGGHWMGAVLLCGLGLYLGYRFGISRNSTYRAYLFDQVIPHPRGRFRHRAAGVATWVVGVEAIKIGVAWLGAALLVRPLLPTTALLLGLVAVAVPGIVRGRSAYTVLSPSTLYSVTMFYVVLYGYIRLIALVHSRGLL